MKKFLSIFLSLGIFFIFVGCGSKSKEFNEIKEITISAAASLEEPMNEIIKKYEAENSSIKINTNYGSSRSLRKQIQEGGKVDLFLSASKNETDALIDSGNVKESEVIDFLTNGLMLVKSSGSKEDIISIKDLPSINGKIALGAEGVPIGDYSKEALKNSGVWDKIQSNIVFCKDAKLVLNYVKSGDVDFSIVYANEINNLGDAKLIEKIDGNLHEKAIYTFANLNAEDTNVKNFKDFINENIDIFKKYNFERK